MDNKYEGGDDMNPEKPEIQTDLEEVKPEIQRKDKPSIEVINGALETYFPERGSGIRRKNDNGDTLN
jgi:hypothetical protein